MSSSPYKEKKVLDVHRVNLLCGAFDGEALLASAREKIENFMIPDAKIKEYKNNTYVRFTNYPGVSEFKKILNYYIDYVYRETLINQIAEEKNFTFNHDQFYISSNQIMKMIKEGMIFGAHSHSHAVMSKLSKSEQKKEIEKSLRFISGFSQPGLPSTYSHPFGGFESFNTATIEILAEKGVEYSFSIENNQIKKNDILLSKHSLPRFDCNFFRYGQAS